MEKPPSVRHKRREDVLAFRKGSVFLPELTLVAEQRAPISRNAVSAAQSPESETPSSAPNSTFLLWDSVTDSLTACSTGANLLMLMPQILQNAVSLSAGRPADLAGLSWVAFSTGFLGNMLLLSYFTQQRQLSACTVQVVGAATTLALLTQTCMAGFMPPHLFAAVASFFVVGCAVNALQYAQLLSSAAWAAWQDLIGVLGLAVLPQVLCSSFTTSSTVLPGVIAAVAGVCSVLYVRSGHAGKPFLDTWQKLSGWTATLLFMFMPVAQLQKCIANPEALAGLSPISSFLGLTGNGLMIPRALFTGDLIWFTGSSWGAIMMGWGMLLMMAANGFIPRAVFGAITISFYTYLAMVLVVNSKALELKSPVASLLHLHS